MTDVEKIDYLELACRANGIITTKRELKSILLMYGAICKTEGEIGLREILKLRPDPIRPKVHTDNDLPRY